MIKTKYQQLFQFLKEYYQLRETTIRDIRVANKYKFYQALEELQTYTGVQLSLLDEQRTEADLIVSLPRPLVPKEPVRPLIPETLLPWLIGDPFSLKDSVRLRESLETEEGLLLLEDHAEIEDQFMALLLALSKWKIEQEDYKDALKIYQAEKKIYDHFFEATNQITAFSERYELLLAVGLVRWNRESTTVFRPLVTVPLSIELLDSGTIQIRLSAEAQLFKVETAFLNGERGLSVPAATQLLEERLLDTDLDFWADWANLKELNFQAFANNLSAEAHYQDHLGLPSEVSAGLSISFSPMIFFRERSLRSFTALFDKVLQHIDQLGPDQHLNLLDKIVFRPEEWSRFKDGQARSTTFSEQEPIILPKVSNEEQKEIIKRIEQHDMVLVQGPPGTGKSHTIANIITYLLGQGKRVLVTAQTDQALKALRAHIPETFLGLIIHFLTHTKGKENELTKSVRQLQDAIDQYDVQRNAAAIQKHQKELQQLREQQSTLIHEIKSLQQADQRRVTLNECYAHKPLVELAEQIRSERKLFSWMQDSVQDLKEALEKKTDFLTYLQWSRALQSADYFPDKTLTVDLNELLLPSEIEDLVQQRETYQRLYEGQVMLAHQAISVEDLNTLIQQFLSLKTQQADTAPWYAVFQQDFQESRAALWAQKSTRTSQLIQELNSYDVVHFFRDQEVDIPEGITPKQLLADVKIVLGYVDTGKKLSGLIPGLFLPKAIKDRRYLFENCLINKSPCISPQQVQQLLQYAEIWKRLEELDQHWATWRPDTTNLSQHFFQYQQYDQQLSSSLEQYDAYLDIVRKLGQLFYQAPAVLTSEKGIASLKKAYNAQVLKTNINKLETRIKESLKYLGQVDHSDTNLEKIKQVLKDTAPIEYATAYQVFQQRDSWKKKVDQCKHLKLQLAPTLEMTVNEMERSQQWPELSDTEIIQAIHWSNAKHQLQYIFSTSVNQKYAAYARNEEAIRDLALKYLKTKATSGFMEKVDARAGLNQYLTRWMQAVRQSRGNGKLAFQYKLTSQKLLKNISQKVPCWIIPLYRLVDTLEPQPEIFDVVIIDEASQLGPEALFLQYISKKIIVVGDDQQTAPENVGVKIDQVNDLIQKNLKGIPDRHFFNTKHSFFDHVNAMAGRRVVLKEHFRCMPEIIEFSNQLCYRDQGIELIPLKQYSANRLAPLQTTFVPNGTYENSLNYPEAQAIVEQIRLLLKQDTYESKTIGVISLQGNGQHVIIDKLLRDELPPQAFKERRLVCGTPPDFQGDERDIIFLSLVTAQDHRRSSLTRDTYIRRYNVAMSRAKEQVWLFHSVLAEDLKPTDLRYRLLHYFQTKNIGQTDENIQWHNDRSAPPPKPFDSWFEVDIYRILVQKDYRVEPQYKVGAYRIDLVVHLANGKKIAIECDGDAFHDLEHLDQDIQRQLVLERAGWEFFRIRYSHFKLDAEDALKKLWILLETRQKEGSLHSSAVASPLPLKKTLLTPRDLNKTPIKSITSERQTKIEVKPTIFSSSQLPKILVFTNKARVINLDQAITKKEVVLEIKDLLEPGEKAIYITETIDYEGFMIFAYKNGKVDRVRFSCYETQRKILNNAFHKDQRLRFIHHFKEPIDLVGISTDRKVIVFSTELISEHTSRGNQGNQLFKKGAKVKQYKLLRKTQLADPEYYRRTTTNSTGYYLKPGDEV